MRSTPEKHMEYFEVLEAFQQPDTCAFCELESRTVKRYLDTLLYENVNDPGLRRKLALSQGFCSRHAHALLRFGDALGIAILYRDQVQRRIESLESRKSFQKKPRESCPACDQQLQTRRRCVQTLLAWVGEADMRRAIEAGSGLCLPHLDETLSHCRDEEAEAYLLRTHRASLENLLGELAELIRKNDYRFRHEPVGSERDAWRRAVRRLTGNESIF